MSNAEAVARHRAKAREVKIPAVRDPRRRKRCLEDHELFLRTYHPEIFYLPFARTHHEILQSMRDAMERKEKLAIAAPRGGAKTKCAIGMLEWGILKGIVRYGVLVCAEMTMGVSRLRDFKEPFERPDSLIAQDFPEAAAPVLALEGAVQRARSQRIDGKPSFLEWGMDQVRFAEVPGAPCSGAILVGKGLEGSIRGLVRGELRPDVVLVDDPQTKESAKSPMQTHDRRELLKQDLEGLAGPGKRNAIIGLWTIIKRWTAEIDGKEFEGDLAYRFTTDIEPDYKSLRFPALPKFPPRRDLVDRYTELVRECRIEGRGDRTARAAHAFFIRHRKEIEDGAEAFWPEAYDSGEVTKEALALGWREPGDIEWVEHEIRAKRLPKNILRKVEVSAIEFQLRRRAEMGEAAWLSEYQNEPPAPEKVEVLSLTPQAVMARTCELRRGVVPPGTLALVAGRDLGRYALHWAVSAILPGRRIHVVDYGCEHVASPQGSASTETPDGRIVWEQIAIAIQDAIAHVREGWHKDPYKDADGTEWTPRIVCSDSRWAREHMLSVLMRTQDRGEVPLFGMGTGKGQRGFVIPRGVPRKNVSRCGALYLRVDQGRAKCYANSDQLKRELHSGLCIDPAASGSVVLFNPEPGDHKTYASHLTAEQEVQLGAGILAWQKVPGRRDNHYLDATAYSIAAAIILAEMMPGASLGDLAKAEKDLDYAKALARKRAQDLRDAQQMPARVDQSYRPDRHNAAEPARRVRKAKVMDL